MAKVSNDGSEVQTQVCLIKGSIQVHEHRCLRQGTEREFWSWRLAPWEADDTFAVLPDRKQVSSVGFKELLDRSGGHHCRYILQTRRARSVATPQLPRVTLGRGTKCSMGRGQRAELPGFVFLYLMGGRGREKPPRGLGENRAAATGMLASRPQMVRRGGWAWNSQTWDLGPGQCHLGCVHFVLLYHLESASLQNVESFEIP